MFTIVTTSNPSATGTSTAVRRFDISTQPVPFDIRCPYAVQSGVEYSCNVAWTSGDGQLAVQYGADPQTNFTTISESILGAL